MAYAASSDFVSYIPTQTADEAIYTNDRASLESPLRLVALDLRVLLANLKYIPYTLLPLHRPSTLPGIRYSSKTDTFSAVVAGLLLVLETVLLVVAPVAALLLPGWTALLCAAAASLLVVGLARVSWGGLIVHSTIEVKDAKAFENERWLFFNGIMTSHESLQTTCDSLAVTFQRPVIAVHNRSFGLVGDIMECILQRSMSYRTKDVRTAYEWLKICVLDPHVKKVVVIAHSQGGIIASLVLNRMLAELPHDAISKLEIYTFGSAASRFNNPLRDSPLSRGSESAYAGMESGGGDKTGPSVVRVIEHYCNEFDMVPRWGVLYSTKQCPHQRYAGQVFVRRQATGHIFDRHYLAPMFPSSLAVKADGHGGGDGQQLDVFLDQLVAVDSTTTQSRKEAASTLKDKMATTVNARQAQQAQQAVPASDWTVYATDECEDERAARAGTAVSVRSLSRLWKYLDGGRG